MSPDEAADGLREELEEILAEIDGMPGSLIRSVEPPRDLGADTYFRVTIDTRRGLVCCPLPTGLAMAYLADEEAAVDEFKRWVRALQVLQAGRG
jgi:hypothetical protein